MSSVVSELCFPPPFKILILIIIYFLTLFNRNVFSLFGPNVKLSWPNYAVILLRHHLHPLNNPSYASLHREHHSEHRYWDRQCLVNDARVEVHVRVQFPAMKVRVIYSCLLQFLCQLYIIFILSTFKISLF
jgi:hypothetical protein